VVRGEKEGVGGSFCWWGYSFVTYVQLVFFLFRNIELVLSDLTPRRASLNIARTRKCGNMKECRNSTKIQDCNSIKETYKKTSKK
jgi:hypothetical protein